LNEVNNTMREMNDNISSKKINDDDVTSMVERWDTTGPR
jgi:hypothetical protein